MQHIDDNAEIEKQARDAIVSIAKKNGWYFVVWYGHFSNQLCIVENTSKKTPEIYCAMYESFYGIVGKDNVLFKYKLPSQFMWKDILSIVKSYAPREINICWHDESLEM